MAKKATGLAAPTSAAAIDPGISLWHRPWFPAALFLLLSLVYFSEFIFSGKIVFGSDVGTDYHRGETSLGAKLGELAQPMWSERMGGFPEGEGLRWQYFPTFVGYLFTTFQRHIGWRYILTVFLAGLAMYLYLRRLGISRNAALWAGVAYMSAPTFLAFPYAGHYAKMAVIALFPLMGLMIERGMDEGRPLYFAGLALLVAAGIYSPHLQMLYYALWGASFYLLFKLYHLYRAGTPRPVLGQRAGLFALAIALGLGVGAEGLFPSFFYTRSESKRAAGEQGRSPEEQLEFARSWALHPEEVGSLLVPEFGGFADPKENQNYYWGRNALKLNSEYFGILVVLLALLALPGLKGQPRLVFMVLLFLFALGYAVGPHTPVHWVFYHLAPGAKVLRTPGMIAFLFAFPACVLAAHSLHCLLEGEAGLDRRLLMCGGVLTGLALLLALAPGAMTGMWISLFYGDIAPAKRQVLEAGLDWLSRGSLIAAAVAGVGTGLLYLRSQGRLAAGGLVAGLILLTLADTWRIDRVFLKYEDPARHTDIRKENPRTVEFIKQDGQLWRVFPLPDYSVLDSPGYHLYGVPGVSGFHDFTLQRYDRLLQELAPVSAYLGAKYYRGQQVPYSDEQLLEAVHPLLNLLSARYIAAPGGIEFNSPAFPLAFKGEQYLLYDNPTALPWHSLVPEGQVVSQDEAFALLVEGKVDLRRRVLLEEEPPGALSGEGDPAQDQVERQVYDLAGGRVSLRTRSQGPRLLLIAENFFPNWQATVDGQPTRLLRANYVWQAVYLPAGEHQVELRYHSRVVSLSRWAALLSLLAVVGVGIWDWRRGRVLSPT
ncbi:MAG: hypothetical protein FJY95_07455 [Candidatus Handelsmanbacteria bacterium]|nr:hypothetical protein [Candidatus Handelsmanbacteria bacterium]